MVNEQTLTLEQAASLAGVSVATLNRYVEFGLIKTVTGDNLVSRTEVLQTFGGGRQGWTNTSSWGQAKPDTGPKRDSNGNHPEEALKDQIEVLRTSEGHAELTSDPKAQATLAEENRRLKVCLEYLQGDIGNLRDERDWLRARLEQLELRAERDQMLLLSERENIRRLIDKLQDVSNPKKRPWRFALPWK